MLLFIDLETLQDRTFPAFCSFTDYTRLINLLERSTTQSCEKVMINSCCVHVHMSAHGALLERCEARKRENVKEMHPRYLRLGQRVAQ